MSSSIPVPVVPIAEEYKTLFMAINRYVYDYMSQPGHDNSHDYHHILRVLSNANILLEAETKTNPETKLDNTVVFLAALLHDVGDHKYAKPGEDPENQVFTAMQENGAPKELAEKVQVLVKHVGYTNEVRNPQSVIDVLARYPELAIIQDADRLDAIGAIGVGRCFAFGGAKGKGRPLAGAIDHFEEKLYKLKGMMKTETGKHMAQARTKVLEDFAKEYNNENKLSFVMQ
jgi:uncharacterized protein